ncbi:MAG TPA: hypothetical protein VMP01_02845 [Pirellulaceae bacterium]|nr:hypothetical protein [Pirellulaceae bacterium]
MAKYRVFLIGGEDDESGVLTTREDKEHCCIAFEFRGRSIHAEADDYFEALCQIRLLLEKERLIPFCYGASLNVYPSGMARDMGLGLKAYRLTIGRDARTDDLVEILTEGPDVIPAFVSRQRDFFDEWIRTPKC